MLTFRKATINDLELFLKWVNDPGVRQTAINPKNISLEEHTLWFTKKIQDKLSHIYVFEKNKVPIGQVRFDKHSSVFLISYSISAHHRGNGYGRQILQQAIIALYLAENNSYEAIEGYVGADNTASRKIFEFIGFSNLGEVNISGRVFIHYRFSRENFRIDHIIVGKEGSSFKRLQSLDQVYDYIRMLNTKEGDNLHIHNKIKKLAFEFTSASIESGNLMVHLKIL